MDWWADLPSEVPFLIPKIALAIGVLTSNVGMGVRRFLNVMTLSLDKKTQAVQSHQHATPQI